MRDTPPVTAQITDDDREQARELALYARSGVGGPSVREQVIALALAEARQAGHAAGLAEGQDDAHTSGYREGYEAGRLAVVTVLGGEL
jgi:hypothetical protein